MKKREKKIRLDLAMVERSIVPSKESALPLIMAGLVLVNDQVVYKASETVRTADRISIKEKNPYVSRGGLKIKNAFQIFSICIEGLNIVDVGISTGGFTDYVLKNGAKQVLGIDVNIDQVDYHLKQDPRLILLKKNAREICRTDLPFDPDLFVMDLSFISILKIMPALTVFPDSRILSLIKPQFEAPKQRVGKGGIIESIDDRIAILLDVKKRIESLKFGVTDFTKAGIKGQKGNQEYFFMMKYGTNSINDDKIVAEIKDV